jgi:hypothetical protein
VTTAVDVFAFGGTAFAMVNKADPYMEAMDRFRWTYPQLEEEVKAGRAPPLVMDPELLEEFGSEVGLCLQRLVDRCTDPKAEERPSMDFVVESLVWALHCMCPED